MESDRTARRERRAAMMASKTERMAQIRSASEKIITGLTQIGDLEEKKIRAAATINTRITNVRDSLKEDLDTLTRLGLNDDGIAALVGTDVADIRTLRKGT